MSQKIENVEGIGLRYGELLRQAGIKSTDELLRQGASRQGREAVSARSGIDGGKILKWVNMCDLFRIKGVAGQYAELLEASGVDTVKELRNRNIDNLYEAIRSINSEKRLVRQTPSKRQITEWIEQARNLEPVVTH